MTATLRLSALAFAAALIASPAAAADMVGHKALYQMSLKSKRAGVNIVNVSGEMLYEWQVGCDGWTTDQKFTLDYVYTDGPGLRFSSHFGAWEAKDASRYVFNVRRSHNGKLTEESRGSATRAEKGLKADFTKPETKAVDLGADVLFPTQHTIDLLKAADQGEKIYVVSMFDGSDGEATTEISAVIGDRAPLTDKHGLDSKLLDAKARKLRMAFFPSNHEGGPKAARPEYEMTLNFLDNGVVADMVIDYEEFSLQGILKAVEEVPAPRC